VQDGGHRAAHLPAWPQSPLCYLAGVAAWLLRPCYKAIVPKGRVLVVDASTRFLERTREILDAAGYDMIPAADGAAGCAHVETGRAHAVLAAVDLPRLSGYELCRFTKRHDATLPVVLLFDKGEPRQPARVWQCGAENFLVRPLKQSELLFAVRDMLAMSNLLKQRASLSAVRPQLADGESGPIATRHRFYQFELFKKVLAIEIKRARRYQYPLSLLLAGLDGGAVKGAAGAARGLADAVRRSIRDIDMPVTFSIDSLLVVMPHTDQKGAMVVGERIRSKVRGRAAHATASVAVVSTDGLPRCTFASLLQAAGKLLQSAHRAGGDRVVGL
jgi:PleD family two-component response regulator